jgi:hypothetical protein
MSEAFLNQVTLDCLLNKEMYNAHLKNTKTQQVNKEERKFYRKRTFNLFKEIINGKFPENLSPDVKYSFDKFVNSTIHYFKTIDNNDIIQSEYKDIDFSSNNEMIDCSANLSDSYEADLLLIRSIKINTPTLDKYVTKTLTKKREEIIFPTQKEINLSSPDLKYKGLKKE